MWKTTLLLVSLAMLLSSCATTGQGTEPEPRIVTRTVDTACDWTRPIYVSKADVLSDETAAAILAHNKAGAKVCGWKPKTK
jgi:hypothetical protein